jgi:hypothetical protein
MLAPGAYGDDAIIHGSLICNRHHEQALWCVQALCRLSLRTIVQLSGCVVSGLHSILEPLDRATQILSDVAEFLGAEDHHYDQQYDQPVPDTEFTHFVLLRI